ncbi:MAG: lipid-A-disaccharide synthase [Simkaniaceae bacterium]
MAKDKAVDYYIFAGERSGDSLGENLLKTLYEKDPNLNILATAGPKMRKYPLKPLLKMEDFEVMGFVDVAWHLPRLITKFQTIKNKILSINPKKVVLIDYPGFNLRLAKALRKKGFSNPIIQYVCPSVWAWKKGRIKTMSENLSLLLTLFPFEPACFSNTPLKARFVGHPITEKIPKRQKGQGPYLALFPGSRKKEIKRNLPLQLQVAKEMGCPIGLSIANESIRPLIEKIIAGTKFPLKIFTTPYSLMENARFAIATSGTINLELALYQVPTVVTFAIKPLDLFIARRILKIDLPFYSLPNILLSKELFPELFGPNFTKKNLELAFAQIQKKEAQIQKSCASIRKILETDKNNLTDLLINH